VTELERQKLLDARFYFHGAWSFAGAGPDINIARGIPVDLTNELNSDKAATRASNMQTSQWLSILRNALAHGGIAYLDKDGRSSYGSPVQMYAFVSGKYERYKENDKERDKLIGVNILRISEDNYRKFLYKRVEWLKLSGLSRLAA
jgi:hypothetical protein